jgi:hydrogenase large subunit
MSNTITLDPVTRIEGHLKVSLDVDGSTVTRAFSSGTSFRGFEPMLSGRDARDVAQVVMRMCGACHVAHGRTGLEALEAIANVTISSQALLLRNIIQAANFIESHLLHFYAMGLPDFLSGLPTVGSMSVTEKLLAVDREGSLDESALRDHAAQAISIRRSCYELIALLGGKIPHPPGLILGGTTVLVTSEMFDSVKQLADTISDFTASIPEADVEALAAVYPAYESLGETGCGHLAHPCFPALDGKPLMSGGYLARDSSTVVPWDSHEITESTASSKLAGPSPLAPMDGVTEPDLSKTSAYTFAKAPRLEGKPCEVGALSRALVNGSTPEHRGVWARYRARAAEARLLSTAIATWLAELELGVSGAPAVAVTLGSGRGYARGEAPRGALGHWVVLSEGKIERYQIISPTTWNASPRDEDDQTGPIEAALSGLALSDPKSPIEAVRIVHSFDPCLQCAVH